LGIYHCPADRSNIETHDGPLFPSHGCAVTI
jgi:hypothetical protein